MKLLWGCSLTSIWHIKSLWSTAVIGSSCSWPWSHWLSDLRIPSLIQPKTHQLLMNWMAASLFTSSLWILMSFYPTQSKMVEKNVGHRISAMLLTCSHSSFEVRHCVINEQPSSWSELKLNFRSRVKTSPSQHPWEMQMQQTKQLLSPRPDCWLLNGLHWAIFNDIS